MSEDFSNIAYRFPVENCPACGVLLRPLATLPGDVICPCVESSRHSTWECRKCGAFIAKDCTDLGGWTTPNVYKHTRWSFVDGQNNRPVPLR